MSQSLLTDGARGLRLALGLALCVGTVPLVSGCPKDDGIVLPPTSDAGVVAVDGGRDTGTAFPDSGISNPGGLSVLRVAPGNGPFTVGNRAVVRGSGFTEASVVTFDGRMVQPADTDLLDPGRLRETAVGLLGGAGPPDLRP